MNSTRSRSVLDSTIAWALAVSQPAVYATPALAAPAPAATSASTEPATDEPEPTTEPPAPAPEPEPESPPVATNDDASAEPPPPRLPASERADAPADAMPKDLCHQGRRNICRERKITGALLTAIGAAALVAGIALMPLDNKTIGGEPAYQRAFRPAGVVLMGGGVLSVTMGVFLLADVVQRKRGAPRPRFAWRTR